MSMNKFTCRQGSMMSNLPIGPGTSDHLYRALQVLHQAILSRRHRALALFTPYECIMIMSKWYECAQKLEISSHTRGRYLQ